MYKLHIMNDTVEPMLMQILFSNFAEMITLKRIFTESYALTNRMSSRNPYTSNICLLLPFLSTAKLVEITSVLIELAFKEIHVVT